MATQNNNSGGGGGAKPAKPATLPIKVVVRPPRDNVRGTGGGAAPKTGRKR